MQRDQWHRLRALFDAAIALAPPERQDFLRRECSDDPMLRRQVESLISASEGRGDTRVGSDGDAEAAAAVRVGQRVGAYEIVREVGRGGMGAVFLGRRADREYEGQVAIKLMRSLSTPEHLRRFRTERQILANLRHPNIAGLLDAGATDDGVPYVVMEFVDGLPIDEYCDRHRLPIDRRLEIFLQVCGAVQYAHRNLVVHRDLKPGNVLVGSDGVPKLLDFGIAKLLEPPADGAETTTAVRLMTPAYASPEQIRGVGVTVATDVYGLGVVLYRLLAGRLPYDVRGKTPGDVERIICHEEPLRPSVAVVRPGPDDPSPEAVGSLRDVTPARLRRQLAGDLDTIVAAALRKEPRLRYESVDRLVDDIARHRRGRPVYARPDTLRYRLGKFVRRHRAGVASAAVVTAAIAGLTAFYVGNLARERDRVRLEAQKSQQVAAFLAGLFEAADPAQARGRDVTARELLERGAERVNRELAAQPAVRATMMGVIGRVYASLGLFGEAAPLLQGALAVRRATAGGDALDEAGALYDLGALARIQGRHAEAESMLTASLGLRRAHLPDADPSQVETLTELARVVEDRGDYPGAERLYREAVTMGRALDEDLDQGRSLSSALTQLGQLRSQQGDHAEARTLLREALGRRRAAVGEDHPSVGESLDALAETLRLDGMLDSAVALFHQAIDHGRRILGERHTAVATRLSHLAAALDDQAKYAEAEAIKREVLALHRANLGEDHPSVAMTLQDLASSRTRLGDYEGAVARYREALALQIGHFGEEHPSVAGTLNNLAHALAQLGDYEGAVDHERRALALDRKLLGDEHPYVGMDLVMVGVFLLEGGRTAAAEQPLREGTAIVRAALGDDHPALATSLYGLGKLLARAGRFTEAEPVAREAVAIRRATLRPGHWETALAETLLGEALAGLGHGPEAESLLVRGYETLRRELPATERRNLTEARERVERFYRAAGRAADAARYEPR